MNFSNITIKLLKDNTVYFLIIGFIILNVGCSDEIDEIDQTNEKLISQKWIRDSYLNKNPDSHFENYDIKSEFQFSPNGNLLIKESKSAPTSGKGLIAPPHGLGDTLIIYAKWTYFENSNTLTLKVDDSILGKSSYNYINWKFSSLDNDQFEIENTDPSNSEDIVKVNFKRKL